MNRYQVKELPIGNYMKSVENSKKFIGALNKKPKRKTKALKRRAQSRHNKMDINTLGEEQHKTELPK